MSNDYVLLVIVAIVGIGGALYLLAQAKKYRRTHDQRGMATTLKLSDELVEMAKPHAAAEHRSIPKQIEYWARLGKAAEDNPDLPIQFIKNTLRAVAEADAGKCSCYD